MALPFDTPDNRRRLRQIFPELKIGKFKITSDKTPAYNCIGWAAGDDSRYWWPIGGYWPDGVPQEETLSAFAAAYATVGYVICDSPSFEEGYEKVVIYAEKGVPKHAARQIGKFEWSSKLGKAFDISHPLTAIECATYGQRALFLKRPIAAPPNPPQ